MDSQINERDLISMKLLHYFITKKNYSPIVVQGVENEIWLENLDGDYKVIRIVNSYIHNKPPQDTLGQEQSKRSTPICSI